MKLPVTGRRSILRMLLTLPFAFLLGCRPRLPDLFAQPVTGEQALERLILLIGPWRDKKQGREFARRFLAADQHVTPYLPARSNTLITLASRFPKGSLALESINLMVLPAPERELMAESEREQLPPADRVPLPEHERKLLLELTRQIYSLIEVRFLLAGELPWGECQADHRRYTRPPAG